MSVALKRLDVVVLFVADVERATAFYRDTLGLPQKSQDPASPAFDLDTTLLLLVSIADAQDLLSPEVVPLQRPAGATSQLVAFVEDVDAVYADLAARGVAFVRPPIDRAWGLRTAHFADPDGHIWELSQPLPSPVGGTASAAAGQTP
jgi:catechol 2,3-dioxygenase-like lactoylglutathione lyase family enzyme